MRNLFAMGITVVFALITMLTAHAATVQTITIKKKVVKMTHQQCVIERMAHAKTDRARASAEKWCTARGDTVPRRW